MTLDVRDLTAVVKDANQKFSAILSEMQKCIVGQHELLQSLLIALLTEGHILLEGLPGLAKTLAVKTLAQVIACDFQRIQFTPDLLPADLIGTSIYNPKEGTFHVKKGPLFTNLVLADEINRAPAKVQSALLEVMAEHQVSIGNETFYTDSPFLVLATQNPIEQEGTYPLPEAQTDRFLMKVKVSYPKREEERQIIHRMVSTQHPPQLHPVASAQDILEAQRVVDDIYVDEKVIDYILDLIEATRQPEKHHVDAAHLIETGASPRASLALTQAAKARAFLEGRGYVTPHDVKMVGYCVLRHRLRLSYEAAAEELTSDDLLQRIFDTIPVP